MLEADKNEYLQWCKCQSAGGSATKKNVRVFLVPSISKNSGRMLFYNTRQLFSNIFSAFFLNFVGTDV
jgi:hypothetical protein